MFVCVVAVTHYSGGSQTGKLIVNQGITHGFELVN